MKLYDVTYTPRYSLIIHFDDLINISDQTIISHIEVYGYKIYGGNHVIYDVDAKHDKFISVRVKSAERHLIYQKLNKFLDD